MRRLCILVVGSDFPILSKPSLHLFLTNSPQIIPDWWHYLDTCYILQTTLTIEQLQNLIMQRFPNQSFLLEEINPKRYAGWLPKEAWAWLERYKSWSVVP